MSGVWASWCRVACGVVLIVAGSGCPLALPDASFACSEQAPDCPPSSLCLLNADGVGGVCRALGELQEVCVAVDADSPGLARPQEDGRRCGEAGTLRVCIAGLCTPITCGDSRKEDQCGDGCRDNGEACDDGNTRDGDGCPATCERLESGFSCARDDSGVDVCTSECGDAIVAGVEACDDGNDNPIDGCDRCRVTRVVSSLVVSGSVDGVVGADFDLRAPVGIAGGLDGALYIADTRGGRVLRHERRRAGHGPDDDECGAALSTAGIGGLVADTVVIAGGAIGPPDFSDLDRRDPDRSMKAIDARFCQAVSVGVDAFGNVYIADALAHRVYHVDVDGTIATVAGFTAPDTPSGEYRCSAGLGEVDTVIPGQDRDGPRDADDATVRLNLPMSLAVDPTNGDVYVLESGNRRVRRLRQRAGEDPQHPRAWTIETVVGRACPLAEEPDEEPDEGSCDPRDDAPASPSEVRFGAGAFVGPTSLSLSPDGDLWVTDPFFPFGRGRLVQVRRECLHAEPVDDACIRILATPQMLPFPTFPFGVHALADGAVLVTDVATQKIWDVSVEPPHRMDLPGDVRAEDGTTLEPLEDRVGLASIESCVFVSDPNANRIVAWSRQRDTLTQILGTEARLEPERLERPGQLSLDADGALYVVDSLGLRVHRFEIDPEQRTLSAAGIVIGQGRLDLIELFGGDSPRPERLGCIRGETLERFSFGQSQFTVGPEGLAAVTAPDGETILFIADSKARQILRLKGDELCDLTGRGPLADHPQPVYVQNENSPEFEPVFLRAVPTDDGFDLLVAEVHNPGGNVVDRDACETGPFGCRLLRLALDREGKRTQASASLLSLAPEVASIRDLLPLPDGRVLIADEGRGVDGGRLWAATIDDATGSVALLELEDPNQTTTRIDLQEPVGLALCPALGGRLERLIVADLVNTSRQNVPRLLAVPLDRTTDWQVIVPAGDGIARGDFGPASAASLKLLEGEETSIGLACAEDGTLYIAERTTDLDGPGLGRIRRIDPTGTITTFVGKTAPLGPSEDAGRARLYGGSRFASLAPPSIEGPVAPLSPLPLAIIDGNLNDESGRVMALGGGDMGPPWLQIAAGSPRPFFVAPGPAARSAQLDRADSAAWTLDGTALLVIHRDGTSVRVFETSGLSLASWRDLGEQAFDDVDLTSLAADPTTGTFVVVDAAGPCLRRLSGEEPGSLSLGPCGPVVPGLAHVAVAPTGVVYGVVLGGGGQDVDQIVRIGGDGDAPRVLFAFNGDDTATDAPVRERPAQLAFDAWGNLAIALTKRVVVITDRDGDREPDVGPSGQLLVAYGEPRERYPERSSLCIETVAAFPAGLHVPALDRPLFVAGDTCLGAAIAIGLDVVEGEEAGAGAAAP
jgi:cysteine-rich repeat protein